MASFNRKIEEEIDLDKLDAEMKMEKIRQTASKLTWEGFHTTLRRNLMEKKIVFDANDRIDLLNALAVLRRGLPVDENADLTAKLRQLADSLECQFSVEPGRVCMKNNDVAIEVTIEESEVRSCAISYFQMPAIPFAEFKSMVDQDGWVPLRTGIHAVLSTVPSVPVVPLQERLYLAKSLSAFERWIYAHAGPSSSFDSLNTLPFGCLVAKTALRPARLFYVAEPSYIQQCKRTALDPCIDFERLPHLELTVSLCDQETEMPDTVNNTSWTSTRKAKACFTLKFSIPMIFSAATWRHMDRYLAKPSTVRQHVNIYRYVSGFDLKKPSLVVRTCFPTEKVSVQHSYEVDSSELRDERDVIVGELHLRNGRELDKVLSLVRAQHQHNSFFESVLASGVFRFRGTHAVRIRLSLAPRSFELGFNNCDHLCVARFYMESGKWSVSVENTAGKQLDGQLSAKTTSVFRKCWSIPVTMVHVFSMLGVAGERVIGVESARTSNEDMQEQMDLDNPNSKFDVAVNPVVPHKVGSAWLLRPTKKPKRQKHSFSVEDPLMPDGSRPIGLLAMFKEPDENEELIPPVEAKRGRERDLREDALAARNTRALSDTTLTKTAFSDLEAIAQLGDSLDDDSRGSPGRAVRGPSGQATPIHAPTGAAGTPGGPFGLGSLTSDPRVSGPIGFGGLMGASPAGPRPLPTPQSVMQQPQLSALETARQKMSMAVGAASDPFELGDDLSSPSQSSFPSPVAAPFGGGFSTPQYPSASPSPLGLGSSAAALRGQTPKRRGRGRKTGNLGEREGSMEGMPPITAPQRKSRDSGVRRPRGPRKVAGQEHQPYDQRPFLQRSFSDAQYNNQPATPMSNASSHDRSMDSPYIESESDDGETDPPPPPKGFQAHTAAATVAQSPAPNTLLPPFSTIITATVPPSPAALAAQSVTVPPAAQALAPFSSLASQRKPSVDMMSSRLSKPSPSTAVPSVPATTFSTSASATPSHPSAAPQQKRSVGVVSDLYDDGTESSPPRKTTASPRDRHPHVQSSPLRPTSTLALESYASGTTQPHPNNIGSRSQVSSRDPTMPVQREPKEKLILKIPKDPKSAARGSPSLDQMRTKSLTKQLSSEKLDRKEKKERLKNIDKVDKDLERRAMEPFPGPKSAKLAHEEKRKRKQDKGDEGTSRKKHKSEKSDKDRDKERSKDKPVPPATPTLAPQFPSLKSFKIPKKDTSEVDASSSAAVTPTTPISTLPPIGLMSAEKRERERERERDQRDHREKKTKGIMKPHSSSSRNQSAGSASLSQIPLPPSHSHGASAAHFQRKPLLGEPKKTPPGPPVLSSRAPSSSSGMPYRWVQPPSGSGSAQQGPPPSSQLPPPSSPSPEPMSIDDADSPDMLKIVEE